MATTIHDIAKEANVSIAAVSKALNDREGVGEELRNRIKAIAERLQYQPFMKSRERTPSPHVQQIAVVYDRYGTHLFEDLQRGIESILPAAGYKEVRFTVSMNEMMQESTKKPFLQKILDDPHFSGIIFVFIPVTDSDIALCKRKNIPVVQLNVNSDAGRCVAIDHAASAYEATEKLIQLGHKIIGHILPNDWVCPVWRDRLTGYKKALSDNGIEYDGAWIANESTFLPRESGLVTRELLHSNPEMTAILYTSDVQAIGGLRMLREMHRKVPEEIAVIGFDDTPMCELVDPPLASVHMPAYEMGKMGAEVLVGAIKDKTFLTEKKVLKTWLVVRRSCDPAAEITPWVIEPGQKRT